jgi:hypothetical protein
MRITLTKRTPGRIEFGVIYGITAILALVAARVLPVLDMAPACVFREIAGIPCPTCGATRSLVCLAHGDFSGALAMNPLAALTATGTLVYFFCDAGALLLRLPALTVSSSPREGTAAKSAALALIAANWLYLIAFL